MLPIRVIGEILLSDWKNAFTCHHDKNCVGMKDQAITSIEKVQE